MTQPTKYTQSFDFSDYTTSNPTNPIQGVRVDVELTALKASLDAVIDNLVFLQNDDTTIKNQSIGLDQLETSLAALLDGSAIIAAAASASAALVSENAAAASSVQSAADRVASAADAAQTALDRIAADASATAAASSVASIAPGASVGLVLALS